MAIAKTFGISKSNMNNVVQIVQDYYKKTTIGLIDARVNDLQININDKMASIKSTGAYLQDYNKSGKLYKFLNYFMKKALVDNNKNTATEIQKNKEEIKVLQETKEKLSE